MAACPLRVMSSQEVPQFLARGGQIVPHLVHVRAYVRRDPVADTAQQQRLGDQALLDAVVQVPLDPAARLVRGGDDPGPGGGHLGLRLGIGDPVATSSVNPASRASVPSGSGSLADATARTPHRRPSTLIGTPTAAPRPISWAMSAAGPEALA